MARVVSGLALLSYLIGIAMWLSGRLSNQSAAVAVGVAGAAMGITFFWTNAIARNHRRKRNGDSDC